MQSGQYYNRIAQALHWGMALLIIPMLLLGEETMGRHEPGFLPSLHASIGLLVMVLVGARIAWRLKHPGPVAIASSRWQGFLAQLVHLALYCAMVGLPVSGWLAYSGHVKRSFGVRPASWFGFQIPLLPDFGINWHLVHNWGGKLVLAFIALHVAAALKHHFLDRDATLTRMLRGKPRSL